MKFTQMVICLNDGKEAVLRSPQPEEAEEMLRYLKKAAGETPFLLRTPKECETSAPKEKIYLEEVLKSESRVMICCYVNGILAGNCQLSRKTKQKNRHRGSIGIALLKEYWGLGIGTAMLEQLLALAKQWGLMQVELEVIEGNERAMGLYRKMGFEIVAATPDAIRLDDGTMRKEYLMVKKI